MDHTAHKRAATYVAVLQAPTPYAAKLSHGERPSILMLARGYIIKQAATRGSASRKKRFTHNS
jgi:hypothetical protein